MLNMENVIHENINYYLANASKILLNRCGYNFLESDGKFKSTNTKMIAVSPLEDESMVTYKSVEMPSKIRDFESLRKFVSENRDENTENVVISIIGSHEIGESSSKSNGAVVMTFFMKNRVKNRVIGSVIYYPTIERDKIDWNQPVCLVRTLLFSMGKIPGRFEIVNSDFTNKFCSIHFDDYGDKYKIISIDIY